MSTKNCDMVMNSDDIKLYVKGGNIQISIDYTVIGMFLFAGKEMFLKDSSMIDSDLKLLESGLHIIIIVDRLHVFLPLFIVLQQNPHFSS